ncbi:GNAT family N-acetyltransferase [Rhodobacteraceae bacterium]|nr:GNAT family N-acetyltransferase [Paracoccaceae bacterium]
MPTIKEIRPATASDAPQMAVILNEIIAIGGTTVFEDPVSADDMIRWYIDAAHCCHVAVDDQDQIAGFQTLERSNNYGPGVGDISSFARQTPVVRGVGTALFAATCNAGRAAGLDEINAKIRADNVPGLAYYSKVGFRDHSVIEGTPLKDGTPVDRIVKRFPLG